MHLIVLFLLLLVIWLVFPKAFNIMVGSWVGCAGAGVLWGFGTLALWFFDVATSIQFTGWSFVATIFVGIVVGCIVAIRD